ncbi:hypothetical protein QUC31_018151, partial [Theobroma cacao]
MEETAILYSSLSLIFLLVCLNFFFQSKKSHKNLPPSPPSLPIVGHLHLVKPPIHRLCHSLSQKYGPIFSLQLGSRLLVVVSSSAAAEECFTRNDMVLANRPKLIRGKHLGYNCTTVVSSSYGEHWRNLRRIGAIEIFSSSRLNITICVRRDEIRSLLLKLSRDSRQDYAKVELKSMLAELTFNNIMRMVAGKRYFGDEVTNEAEAREFRGLIAEVFKNGGATNPADFLPMLNWFGQYEKKDKELGKRMDGFLQKLIDEHRSNRQENTSMIAHLLSLQESDPHYYTDDIMKGLILKARAEIDSQIGQENLIDEPDVAKLHYLQSVVSETLRLYPAVPLLLPHMASSDCTIGGYDVPRGTVVLVNAWAIHRDPKLWDDPTSFKPERFENEKGESHKLMPFGLGRRACPGPSLAQRLVGLTLGSLIQCFEWERVDGKEIDMTEGTGSTMPKAQPLEAMCKARPIVNK